ncbi:MAG TPA: C25 family cysteine peptidase, partial [Kiritimatiellia bacterium]|nr:C25 family cysteine peptidase [Kiritimatiellia bacterium]
CPEPDTSFLLPPMNGLAGDFAPRRAGAEAGANLRIEVPRDGLYRLNRAELLATGLPGSEIVGGGLRLFNRTQEVARFVSTEGVFGASDYLLFYGVAHRGEYTTNNVYWLATGAGSGVPFMTRSAATNAGGVLVTGHCHTVRYNPEKLFRPNNSPLLDNINHWFADLLLESNSVDIAMSTQHRIPSGLATLTIEQLGITTTEALTPDHRTEIRINDNLLANITYNGMILHRTSVVMNAQALADGGLTWRLRQTMTNAAYPRDRALLRELSVTYPRLLRPISGQLAFCGTTGPAIYGLEGWPTGSGAWVLDVSNPFQPVLLTGWSEANVAGGKRIWFRDDAPLVRRYVVAADSAVTTLPAPVPFAFRNLADTNQQADFLFLTHHEFRSSAFALARHRLTNGLSVSLVDMQDVYNEFGYGVEDAEAIKQFIGFAYHHWKAPRPRFVLLGGDGTYDPKNNLGGKSTGMIPTKFLPAWFRKSPSDTWFVTVDRLENALENDSLPDLAIGRIPVVTNSWFNNAVSKTMRFEGLPRLTNATVIADEPDGNPLNNFHQASNSNIISSLPGYSLSVGYLGGPSAPNSPPAIRQTISNTVHQGQGRFLVTYFGHGREVLWSDANLLNAGDAVNMTNSVRNPIFAVFSCQVARFTDPAEESLGEELLQRFNRGASVVMGPTDLAINLYSERVARGFVRGLAVNKDRHVGEAWQRGMLELFNYNPNASEMRFYSILGDPALVVNP